MGGADSSLGGAGLFAIIRFEERGTVVDGLPIAGLVVRRFAVRSFR